MLNILHDLLIQTGLQNEPAAALVRTAAVILVVLLAFIADLVARKPLLAFVRSFAARTGSNWDDILLEHQVFHQLSHLAPALIIYFLGPLALEGHPNLIAAVKLVVWIYLILIGTRVIDLFLNGVGDIWSQTEGARNISLKGFIQFFKIILYLTALVLIVSSLVGRSPLYLLSGLTALTAVLLFIFKDPILGLLAGIQLSANRMVAQGDWIEMPKYGADGDVLEVALTTVKVQNWDKTVTTIPTYALISESFKNWRGMQESGGRRIKRSIFVDMNSITHCDEEMLERFARIQYISAYIDEKKRELESYNQTHAVDPVNLVNGRRMTNVGTFRAYIAAYLRNHLKINQEMTFLVRQLDPTPNGLPLQIYVFCNDVVWANYEAIQADIFDHLLAIMGEFDLRVFQEPAGGDVRALGGRQPD
ncbi:MAG: mechanosensitive ion channel [Candidatus Latescibacteria bacterium]|nr:mechanosensitive ion channel [Candidatus Latescibacterota bacterium]